MSGAGADLQETVGLERSDPSTVPPTPAPVRSALGHTGQVFADLRAQGRGALVGFLPVGYPDLPVSLRALRGLTGEGEWVKDLAYGYGRNLGIAFQVGGPSSISNQKLKNPI